MAQRVDITLIDDLTGDHADQTVTFAVDGVDYEIDLSADNAAALRQQLGPFMASGRRLSSRRERGGQRSAGRTQAPVDTTAVRVWARSNGYEVADRGRIRSDVVDAYRAAGN